MIRPLTGKDVLEFYGEPFPMTVRGVVSETEDGKVVGVAAYFVRWSCAIMFSDIADGVTKKDIVRGTREAIRMAKESRLPVAAAADKEDAPLLRHFGFVRSEWNPDFWILADG